VAPLGTIADMSKDPPIRRRWFQFSLTSLFVLTTLIAIWLAWELAFIREREAWLRENPGLADPDRAVALIRITGGTTNGTATLPVTNSPASPPREAFIPRWRKWLGDAPVATIVDADFTDDDRAHLTRLFPEAELVKQPPVNGTTFTFTATFAPSDSIAPAEPGTDETDTLPPAK
jgi:hypothetical protein